MGRSRGSAASSAAVVCAIKYKTSRSLKTCGLLNECPLFAETFSRPDQPETAMFGSRLTNSCMLIPAVRRQFQSSRELPFGLKHCP